MLFQNSYMHIFLLTKLVVNDIAIKFVYGIKKNMAPPGIFNVKTLVKYVILKI